MGEGEAVKVLRPIRVRARSPEGEMVELTLDTLAVFRLPDGSYLAVPETMEEAYLASNITDLARELNIKDLTIAER